MVLYLYLKLISINEERFTKIKFNLKLDFGLGLIHNPEGR